MVFRLLDEDYFIYTLRVFLTPKLYFLTPLNSKVLRDIHSGVVGEKNIRVVGEKSIRQGCPERFLIPFCVLLVG